MADLFLLFEEIGNYEVVLLRLGAALVFQCKATLHTVHPDRHDRVVILSVAHTLPPGAISSRRRAVQGWIPDGSIKKVPRSERSQPYAGMSSIASCWSCDSLNEMSRLSASFQDGCVRSRWPTSSGRTAARK